MSRQGRQAVRRHLFAQDPHCHWCGCEVVLFEGKTGRLPLNAATIDHLVTRLDANGSRTPEQGR